MTKPILHTSINTTIESQNFTLSLTVDCCGVIKEVKNLFFDLPKEAQKMMLGKVDQAIILAQLDKYETLLKYRLPAALADVIQEEDLAESVNAIRAKRAQLGFEKYPNEEEADGKWLKSLYREAEVFRKNLKHELFTKHFHHLRILLSNCTTEDELRESIKTIASEKRYENVAFDVLVPLFPLLFDDNQKYNTKQKIYELLKAFPTASHKTLLLEHFVQKKEKNLKEAIISALLSYTTDENICNLAISYIDNAERSYPKITNEVVEFAANFPNEKNKEFIFSLIEGEERFGYITPVASLQKMGVPAKTIANRAKAIFRKSNNKNQLANLHTTFDEIDDGELMPSLQDILDLSNRNTDVEDGHIKSYSSILKKRANQELINDLEELLDHEKAVLRGLAAKTLFEICVERIIIHIYNLEKKKFERFTRSELSEKFPLSTNAKKKLKLLFEDESKDVQRTAISTLGRNHLLYRDKGIVPDLLDKLSHSEEEAIQLTILELINELMYFTDLDSSIIEVYKTMLLLLPVSKRASNDKLLQEAIRGLKCFIEPKALKKLLNTEHPAYKKALKQIEEVETVWLKVDHQTKTIDKENLYEYDPNLGRTRMHSDEGNVSSLMFDAMIDAGGWLPFQLKQAKEEQERLSKEAESTYPTNPA
ncbi:MAG: hypothetical protein AAF806_25605 [Bacteroidota bacterium]